MEVARRSFTSASSRIQSDVRYNLLDVLLIASAGRAVNLVPSDWSERRAVIAPRVRTLSMQLHTLTTPCQHHAVFYPACVCLATGIAALYVAPALSLQGEVCSAKLVHMYGVLEPASHIPAVKVSLRL